MKFKLPRDVLEISPFKIFALNFLFLYGLGFSN